MKIKLIAYVLLCVILMGLSSALTAMVIKHSGDASEYVHIEGEPDLIKYIHIEYDKTDWRYHINPIEYEEYLGIYLTMSEITNDWRSMVNACRNELEKYGVANEKVSTISHAYEDLEELETYKKLKDFEVDIYYDENMVAYSKRRPAGDGMGFRFSIIYCDDIGKISKVDDYDIIENRGSLYLCLKNPPSVVYNYIVKG